MKKIKTITFVDADPLASARLFVETLTSDSYRYRMETFAGDLTGSEDKLAYLALRQNLHELLEVIAATAAASIQAPEAVFVWLIKYLNRQLDECIDVLLEGAALPSPSVAGHREQAGHIFSELIDDMSSERPDLRAALYAAGEHLFRAYRDTHREREYNSIKHGQRVRTGAFQAQTDRVKMDWDRTVIFQTLEDVHLGSEKGQVLAWGLHPVDPVFLLVQTELALRWLDVLRWTLRRQHGVAVHEPHPGFAPLDEVNRAWLEGPGTVVLTQRLRDFCHSLVIWQSIKTRCSLRGSQAGGFQCHRDGITPVACQLHFEE